MYQKLRKYIETQMAKSTYIGKCFDLFHIEINPRENQTPRCEEYVCCSLGRIILGTNYNEKKDS